MLAIKKEYQSIHKQIILLLRINRNLHQYNPNEINLKHHPRSQLLH